MRIKECYIENFGGLSKVNIEFNEDFTVINRPNGFGKTTLANFIKAMFYGFSSTTKRNIKDNDRKKFTPWNGGKFGGYVIFEHNQELLKLERYFGKTARSDEVKLYDLKNNRCKSNCQSDLGVKFFELDAESFMRSIYIEESPVQGRFDTDSIKAKLADLVDDSDDVNNFERATKEVKDRVNELTSSRKSNTEYKAINDQISLLDDELTSARILVASKDRLTDNLRHARSEIDRYKSELNDVKNKIHSYNNQTARQSIIRQIKDLETELDKKQKILEQFDSEFPKGTPNEDERSTIISIINEITELRASINSSTLRSVRELKTRLDKIFSSGVPSELEINTCKSQIDDMNEHQIAIKSLKLSEIKSDRLRRLREKFSAGIPSDVDISKSIRLYDEVESANRSIDNLSINELKANVNAYTQYFPDGAPEKSELDDCKNKLKNIELLREANNALACEIGDIPDYSEQVVGNNPKINISQTIIGIALTITSIVLGIALHPGMFAGMIIGVFLFIKSFHKQAVATNRIENGDKKLLRDKMLHNSDLIRKNETDISSFLAKFAIRGERLADKISDLDAKVNSYNLCMAAYNKAQLDYNRLNFEINDKQSEIQRMVGEYIDIANNFSDGISTLKADIAEYFSLRSEADRYEEEIRANREEIQQIKESITLFLSKFYSNVSADSASDLLDKLSKDLLSYTSAVDTLREADELETDTNSKIIDAYNNLSNILDRYGIDAKDITIERVQFIANQANEYTKSKARANEIKEQLSQIRENNSEILGYSDDCTELDIEQLREDESRLVDNIGDTQVVVSELEKKLGDAILAEDSVSNISEQLEYWIEARDNCLYRAKMLSKLLELLSKARDNLSHNYLGQVESGFKEYMGLVDPDIGAKTSISSDLNVMLTELGSFKEQDFLSSGESDIINLCMRLALIKSMFKKDKPFIIMDDPFIHLDDKKLNKLSKIFEELSKQYQIIYLTCSKSRELV